MRRNNGISYIDAFILSGGPSRNSSRKTISTSASGNITCLTQLGIIEAVPALQHVTKEGNIAGPKVLEHMVDTVIYFEGDKYKSYRLLRAVKNRFGNTSEVGIFDMQSKGLQEVKNPRKLTPRECARLQGFPDFWCSNLENAEPTDYEIEYEQTNACDNFFDRFLSILKKADIEYQPSKPKMQRCLESVI